MASILETAYSQGRKVITVFEAKRILIENGFPVNKTEIGTTEEELQRAAGKVGFPCVLKVESPDIIHKTDVGGVIIGIRDASELITAFTRMRSHLSKIFPRALIEGFVVEEMVDHRDSVETIIGSSIDPIFGKVLMFGLGGIFVEVLKDVSFRLIPLIRKDAEEMIEEIKGAKILDGIRGRPPVDKRALVELLLKTSKFVDAEPKITELDLNPVFASKEGMKIVDARIVLNF